MSIDINSVWEELKQKVAECENCGLCKTRHNTVFGYGPIDSKVVIIGEGPGADEDEQGKPFVGSAGQLLTKILEDGGKIKRSSIYITNIVKCRPPNNRDPSNEEILMCSEFLEAQLLLLRPKIIVTLGNIATKTLATTATGITKLRGEWRKIRGIDLLPMFHPSYLLHMQDKSPENIAKAKRLTWQDVLSLRAKIMELGLDKEMLINDRQQENPDAPSDNS